jgi:hypothetical protein
VATSSPLRRSSPLPALEALGETPLVSGNLLLRVPDDCKGRKVFMSSRGQLIVPTSTGPFSA